MNMYFTIAPAEKSLGTSMVLLSPNSRSEPVVQVYTSLVISKCIPKRSRPHISIRAPAIPSGPHDVSASLRPSLSLHEQLAS